MQAPGAKIEKTVTVTQSYIVWFASRWPASGLGGAEKITFTFADNGDLVDLEGEPEGADGGAMVALAEDAKKAGQNGYRFLSR